MIGWIRRLFGRGEAHPNETADDQAARRWYDQKSALMESALGKEHDSVMHAIIPFEVGGGLDLYYYPNGVPGTAVATKELCELPGKGPSNQDYSCYELVMFTKAGLNLDQANDSSTLFGKANHNINSILNLMARYAFEAKLNPRETCEFPAEMKGVGGKCVIFDGYASKPCAAPRPFGLLLILEIFRSEMEFARKSGAGQLFQRLKSAKAWPYSDLDRDPVA